MILIYVVNAINIKAGKRLSVRKIIDGFSLLNKDWIRRHRHAGFILLSAFIVAQVLWWVIFQMRFSNGMQETQQNIWNQQIHTAEVWLESHPEELKLEFMKKFPDLFSDLEYDHATGELSVSQKALEELEESTSRVSRMFIGEGLFFTMIIIAGIVYLSWSLQRELEYERTQANFLAATSHELKTPVTAIRLLMEPLASEDFPKEQKKVVYSSMLESLDRLQILIDQLLMAKSTQNGFESDSIETVDIGQITKETVDAFYIKNNPIKKLEINQDYKNSGNVNIIAEHWILVLNNILNNCLKYSGDSVIINSKLHKNGKNIILEVSDNGFGFPPINKRKIFRRFYRYLDDNHQNIPGTGLGLYLSRELLKQYGGSITADSDGHGKGATFTLKLPVVKE